MGRFDREVRLFGVSMKLRYWILALLFIVVAMIGYLTAILYSPLIYDLIGTSIGTVSLILATLTIIYGASKTQIETFREDITKELKSIREILEEIFKVLAKR